LFPAEVVINALLGHQFIVCACFSMVGDKKALRRIGAYQKGDERKYHLKSNGFNFEKILGRVAELLDLKPEQVLAVGKYKKTVAARSLLCF